jgi:lipopolysaccharide export system permease protein
MASAGKEETSVRLVVEHMLREFWRYFLLLLGIFTFIYLLVDLLDHIDNFIEYQSTIKEVALYYLYKTPFIVLQMGAISVLLAVVITFSLMHRNNEITALKAGGVSVYRLSLPFILVALFISLVNFALAEGVVPAANVRVYQLWNYEMRHNPASLIDQSSGKHLKAWYRAERAIYNVKRFHGDSGVIEGVSLYFFDDRFELIRRVDAKTGIYSDEQWTFYEGTDKSIAPGGRFKTETFDQKTILLPVKPADFRYVDKTADQMSLAELEAFIAKLKREGYETTYYQIDRQVKFSLPFVCTVLTILAVPLTLRQHREASMARGAAVGVGAAFAYLAFFAISRSLGHSETLPVLLAAWLPNIVFGLVGAYLLVTLRQ